MKYAKESQLNKGRLKPKVKPVNSKKGKKKSTVRLKPKPKEEARITPEVYNQVLKRDKGRCVACGSTHRLECHHIGNRNQVGGSPEELCMLCHNCHIVEWHGKGSFKVKIKVYKYMISIGIDYSNELQMLRHKMNSIGIGRRK